MDELIGRLVANLGVERTTAETAVGIILAFLAKEGPPDKIQTLLAKLPGAEALMQKAPAGGGGMGGVMGAGMQMMSAGLGMGQVQDVTREFIAFAREKVGEDAVGEIVGSIPGLSQFVWSAPVPAHIPFDDREKSATAYPITEIQAIGADAAQILKRQGIRTTVSLLRSAKTPRQRLKIAEKIGIGDKHVLGWVTAADRMRVKGVGWEYAQLLLAVGVKTATELKYRNPRNLVDKMAEANTKRKLVRVLPSVSMVSRWIDSAKKLPPLIRY